MADADQEEAAPEPVIEGLTEDAGDGEEDPELEDMKRRVQEMEEEANKLKAMQQDLAADGGEGEEKKASETDEKSIYVGQVDYEATPEELQAHFANCGTINRVTILCDKFTGRSKGFAYVEFEDSAAVPAAILLDNSIFKGRQLKVSAKRVNVRGKGKGKGRGRGRGRGRCRRGKGYKGYRGW